MPLQIGHTLVTDTKVVTRREYTLRWTRHPGIDQRWLREKIDYVRDRMEFNAKLGGKTGKTFQLTYEKLDREGRDPVKVLRYYRDLFADARKRHYLFVGNQAWFDATLLSNYTSEFLDGQGFDFDDDELLDTGSLVKSIQLDQPLLPKPDDTLKLWSRRVNAHVAPGVKWSIDHAVRLFGLDKDPEYDPDKLHGAGCDSYWVHRLFEKLRGHLNKALEHVDDEVLHPHPSTERRRRRFKG